MSFTPGRALRPASEAGLDLRIVFRWEEDVTAGQMECALRHLAVAATRLARQEDLGGRNAARYAAVEARLRSLLATNGDIRGHPGPAGPVVATETAGSVPLAALLVGACQGGRGRLRPSAIDPDLVEAARELLCGLNWSLPGPMAPETAN